MLVAPGHLVITSGRERRLSLGAPGGPLRGGGVEGAPEGREGLTKWREEGRQSGRRGNFVQSGERPLRTVASQGKG